MNNLFTEQIKKSPFSEVVDDVVFSFADNNIEVNVESVIDEVK